MRRFLLAIILVCLLSSVAYAQEAVTVSVNEMQLNQAMSQALRQTIVTPLGTVETMLVDVGNTNVVLHGTLKRPNSELWTYKITLASTVIAQKPQWIIVDATYTDVHSVKSPRDAASGVATGRIIDVWEHAFATVSANNFPRPISPSNLNALSVLSISLSADVITTTYYDQSLPLL